MFTRTRASKKAKHIELKHLFIAQTPFHPTTCATCPREDHQDHYSTANNTAGIFAGVRCDMKHLNDAAMLGSQSGTTSKHQQQQGFHRSTHASVHPRVHVRTTRAAHTHTQTCTVRAMVLTKVDNSLCIIKIFIP